jgi:hypothetical protein
VQRRELVDERFRDLEHVIVLGGGEAAASRIEVFEHHHERSVSIVEAGVPHLRHAHGQLVADRRVQLRLRDPETDHGEEGALVVVEGLELDEERVGERATAPDADLGPTGGAGMGVEHLDG